MSGAMTKQEKIISIEKKIARLQKQLEQTSENDRKAVKTINTQLEQLRNQKEQISGHIRHRPQEPEDLTLEERSGTEEKCSKCGCDLIAHYGMVEGGELVSPYPIPCMECGCRAVVDNSNQNIVVQVKN